MKIQFILIVISFLLNPSSSQIQVNRFIENNGFHRYLSTEIRAFFYLDTQFPAIFKNNCTLLVAESFDSNFYVDNYELNQPIYKKSFSFILSRKVNTESAEYASRNFNLFMYLNPQIIKCYSPDDKNITQYLANNTDAHLLKHFCRIFYRLPIHARYQSPSANGDYANFNLRAPNLFAIKSNNVSDPIKLANIDLEELISSTDFPSRLVFPCQKGQVERRVNALIRFTNDYLTQTFFDSNGVEVDESTIRIKEMCLWGKLGFESLNEYGEVKVTIPVGDQNYELLVLIVTLMLVSILALNMAYYILQKGISYKKINLT